MTGVTLHDTQDAARRVQRETPQPYSSSSVSLSSLALSDAKVYELQIRALLRTVAQLNTPQLLTPNPHPEPLTPNA